MCKATCIADGVLDFWRSSSFAPEARPDVRNGIDKSTCFLLCLDTFLVSESYVQIQGQRELPEKILVTWEVKLRASLLEDLGEIGPGRDLDGGAPQVDVNHDDM
jgi:hypothetical protein